MTSMPGRSEERFDVVDERNEVIGQLPRSEIHRLGLRHRAIHLLVFNDAGEVLLQKRSTKKDTFPGCWDSSVSGHVDAGEAWETCVRRESEEEIGYSPRERPEELFRLTACPQTGQEFIRVYRCRANGPFELSPAEIDEARWFKLADLDRRVIDRPQEFASAFVLIWRRYRSLGVAAAVAAKRELLVGLDLGGSRIKAVALTPEGTRHWSRRVTFQENRPLEWSRRIRELTEAIDDSGEGTVVSLGLAAPGLVAEDDRSIWHMPGRLRGLERLNWSERLGRPVKVLNDAQAALLGESWMGAAQGLANVVFLTLGTGVGGAAMVDGNMLRGVLGRAGHLGHMCLDADGPPDICRTPGSLEQVIGNCSIRQRSGGRFADTLDLIQAMRAGDRQARFLWLKSVRLLSCGLVSLINLFDPEAIVIGGGIALAGGDLFDPIANYLAETEWLVSDHQVPVKPARLGDLAGATGAAISAYRDFRASYG